MTNKDILKNRRVLLVDDDQSIRVSLSYYFRRKVGFFAALETAEQALHHLQDQVYDVVICDYRLPGMNGLDFFQELNRHSPGALKIMVTAFGNLDLALEAIKIGVSDFIMKPFQAATMEQSIAGLIARREKEIAGILGDGKMPGETEGHRLEQMESLLRKVSHQLNNTLQVLLGNVEIGLWEAEDNERVRVRLENIFKGIGVMMGLSKQLTLDPIDLGDG
ncbi:MAG: response regulator [Desulfobaccales bacterium]